MSKAAKIIIYGVHAVNHALRFSSQACIELWLNKDKKDNQDFSEIISLGKKNNIPIHLVNQKILEEKTDSPQHQGVALHRQAYDVLNEKDLEQSLEQNKHSNQLFLVLDNVQDPHNLGACFRTADSVGVDGIISAKDRSVGLTATVCKVASGGVESVPFYSVTNLARTLRSLKDYGIWVYGLAGEAVESIHQTKFTASTAIVMGAEGDGLRDNTKKHCDQLIKIPMKGNVESLNVSVATAVCLYEVMRQLDL